MPEKSPRRLKLEESLAQDPSDPFLRYGLAMAAYDLGYVAYAGDGAAIRAWLAQ